MVRVADSIQNHSAFNTNLLGKYLMNHLSPLRSVCVNRVFITPGFYSSRPGQVVPVSPVCFPRFLIDFGLPLPLSPSYPPPFSVFNTALLLILSHGVSDSRYVLHRWADNGLWSKSADDELSQL